MYLYKKIFKFYMQNFLMHIIKYFMLLAICFFCHNTFGQQQKNIITTNIINQQNGLASKQVFCGLQASDGFIWLGTANGLQRYDGKTFITFNTTNSNLKSNIIAKIIEDEQQQLWIMYGESYYNVIQLKDQVDIFDLKKYIIKPFVQNTLTNTPFKVNNIGPIFTNEKKELLFLEIAQVGNLRQTLYNAFVYNTTTGFKKLNLKIALEFSNQTELIFKNKTILSSNNHRLNLFNIDSNANIATPVYANNSKLNYLYPLGIINNAEVIFSENATSPKKNIQIVASNLIKNSTTYLPFDNMPNSKIIGSDFTTNTTIYDAKTGNSILANLKGDVQLLQGKTSTQILSAANNTYETIGKIYNYFTSTHGSHWLCAQNGLYQIKVQQNYFEHLASDNEFKGQASTNYQNRNIMEDETGNIVFCSWGGVYKYSLNKTSQQHTLINTWYLNADRVMFYDNKYYWYYNNTDRGKELKQVAYGGKIINAFNFDNFFWAGLRTKQNNIIVSNNKNIYVKTGNNFKPIVYINGNPLPQNWVQQYYYTANGNLWAASSAGLFAIDSNNRVINHYFTKYNNAYPNLPALNIHAMLQTADGNIWLATNGEGLIKWNQKANTIKKYTTSQGLSSNVLNGILQDDKGYLWISSDNGLNRFNTQTELFKIYTTQNGLTHNEFNRCAFLKAKNGIMYFGGLNGINAFKPQNFWADTLQINIPFKITNFTQFNNNKNELINKTQELLNTNIITVTANDKFFTLDFQLLDFNTAYHNYEYKIVDIDKNWIALKANSLYFASLPYGTHTLIIKAKNAAGLWNSTQIKITIHVIQPITKKPIFYVLLFFIGLILFIFYFNKRNQNLRKNAKKLEQTIQLRTNELSQSLIQKEVLLKEIHHRVKNNLSVIGSLLALQQNNIADASAKAVLQESQNRIKSIALIHQSFYQHKNLAAIEFKTFTNQLYQLVNSIFKNSQTQVFFNNNVNCLLLDIDTAVPIGLILNELFTNSFKYAFNNVKNGNITINITNPANGTYILNYNDSGNGLPPHINFNTAQTLGLTIIKMLAKQLSGSATYTKSQTFTTFNITFIDTLNRNLK